MRKRVNTKEEPLREEPRALCVACRGSIPKGATVCAECGTYQRRWRNWLQFAAAVTGVLSLVGAATVYVLATAPEIRRTLVWQTKLNVIAFESHQGITVVNVGDGPVLLSHVAITIERVGTATMPINELAQRAGMVRHYKPGAVAQHWKSFGLIEHPTAQQWDLAIKSASPIVGERNYCTAAIVFTENDPTYLMYAAAHRSHRLPSVPASAVLHYYDLRTGLGSIKLPVRALLFRSSTCPERDPSVH